MMEAITLTRHELDGKVPLIGFSGAPVSTRKTLVDSEEPLLKASFWACSGR